MIWQATCSPPAHPSKSRLSRLLNRLRQFLRPHDVEDRRPARLDLVRLSDHDLRDLGLPPRSDHEMRLSAPWLPGSRHRSHPHHLPPI